MLVRVNTNFNVRVAIVIQCQAAWIEHIINYRAVLAQQWCMRKIYTTQNLHVCETGL